MPTRPPRVYIRRYDSTQVRVESPATSYKARLGELFFDTVTSTLRLGNGVTTGGVILAGAEGDVSSQLVNGMATFSLESDGDVVIQGTLRDAEGNDLLAQANEAPAIAVATSTVLGGVKLGEGFTTDGSDKVTTNKLYSTDLTQPTQHYRLTLTTTGTITLPDNSEILGATLKSIHGNYAGITSGPDAGHSEESWVWVDNNGVSVATSYSGDILPAQQWQFTNDGKFQLPAGGSIVDSNGTALVGEGASGGTANFAFDTSTVYNTMYLDVDGNNSFMSLSPSGVEGQAYISIPGDNYVANGLGIYNSNSNGRVLIQTGSNVEISAANSNPNGRFIVSVNGNQTSFETDGGVRLNDSGRITRTPYPTGSASVSTNSYADPYADPVAAGMTDLDLQGMEYEYDDASYSLQLPWDIKVFGRKVSNITLSSNAYIVFEKSVNNADYIPSPGNAADMVESVPQPFLCIYGRDGGWHKVWTKNEGSSFVIRFTGDPYHNGWNDTDTLIYNVRFYENSDQIDVTCVANSGEPSLAFLSDSWSNVLSFNNAQGNAYAFRTSPYLYDADGNITVQGNVLPAEDNAQYLGSIDKRWHTLYVGPGTIDVDGLTISKDADGNINFGGTSANKGISFNDSTTTNISGALVDNTYTVTYSADEHLFQGPINRGNCVWVDVLADLDGVGTAGHIYSGQNQNLIIDGGYEDPSGAGATLFLRGRRLEIRANVNGQGISSKDWVFTDDGNLQLPNGNVIGGGEIPAVVTTSTSITSYDFDASGNTVMLTTGMTVDFPNFSGTVLVNCFNSGTVTQFFCGGGGTPQVGGSSKVTTTGTMADNGAIGGYTFTATETGEHSFYVVRTRTGA